MFSFEINGYNKKEVDDYILELKAQYETKIMEERLKNLEAEKELFEIKKEKTNLEYRIKNILAIVSTLNKVKEFEEKGMKNLYTLKIKQINLISEKTERLIEELDELDDRPDDLIIDFKNLLNLCKRIETEENLNDSNNNLNSNFKTLLEKMNEFKLNNSPKEVKIERNTLNLSNNTIQNNTPIVENKEPPVIENKEPDDEPFTRSEKLKRLIDHYLGPKNREVVEKELENSGFDFSEALHPTEDLEEIMKAFDFYNSDN